MPLALLGSSGHQRYLLIIFDLTNLRLVIEQWIAKQAATIEVRFGARWKNGRTERSVVKRIGNGTVIVPFIEAKDVFEDN
jgi:hypothetical protein